MSSPGKQPARIAARRQTKHPVAGLRQAQSCWFNKVPTYPNCWNLVFGQKDGARRIRENGEQRAGHRESGAEGVDGRMRRSGERERERERGALKRSDCTSRPNQHHDDVAPAESRAMIGRSLHSATHAPSPSVHLQSLQSSSVHPKPDGVGGWGWLDASRWLWHPPPYHPPSFLPKLPPTQPPTLRTPCVPTRTVPIPIPKLPHLPLSLSLSLSLSLPLLPFLPIPLVHGCKSSLPSCRGSALQSNWLKHSLNPKETNHYLLPSPISPLCLSFLPHAYPVSLSLWINLLFRLYSPFTRSIAGSPSVPGIPLFLTLTPAVSAAFYPRMCNSTVSLPSSVALLSRLAPPSSNPYRKPDVDASVASLCSGVLLLSIRIAACFSFEISRGNFLDELRLCRQMRGQEAAASRIVVADSQVYTYGYTRRRTVTWLCLARVVPSKDCL